MKQQHKVYGQASSFCFIHYCGFGIQLQIHSHSVAADLTCAKDDCHACSVCVNDSAASCLLCTESGCGYLAEPTVH